MVVAAGRTHRRVRCARNLPHRNRFAGEQRFVYEQVVRFHDHRVGRHPVALDQQQVVAAHHFSTRDPLDPAVSNHRCPGAGQIAQGLERALGLALLVERDADNHDDKTQQHQRILRLAQHEVDDAGANQHQQHRLTHDVQDDSDNIPPPSGRQFVRAPRHSTWSPPQRRTGPRIAAVPK